MKKIFFVAGGLCTLLANAQTTLYNNDFTSGSNGWSFSTQNQVNDWIVNNIYNCSTPTPNQGGGNYLHVYDFLFATDYCAFYNNLGLGSGDVCYAAMTSGINTTGQPGVIVTFDWLCSGQTGNIVPTYGFVDYSTNGGVTWTNIASPLPRYNGQGTWTQATITSVDVPAFLNQSDLRLRFGFNSSGYGNNPAFAIDNLKVVGNTVTAVKNNSSMGVLAFFPNPSHGIFTLRNSGSCPRTIAIYNMMGEKVFDEKLQGGNQDVLINLSQLPKGVYSYRSVSEDRGIASGKLVIE